MADLQEATKDSRDDHRLPVLLLIQLKGVLVFISTGGELPGVVRDGYDGSSTRRPFYIVPGAVELLRALSGERCVLAVVTEMAMLTCEPLLDCLRRRAGLGEDQLLCFDRTSMRNLEDGTVHLDGKPELRYCIDGICSECCDARGIRIDPERSLLAVTDIQRVREGQHCRVLELPHFSAKDISDNQRRAGVEQELREALLSLKAALADPETLLALPRSDRISKDLKSRHPVWAGPPGREKGVTGKGLQNENPSAAAWSAKGKHKGRGKGKGWAQSQVHRHRAAGPQSQHQVALIAVDLNELLVYRSEVGGLQGAQHDGHDGTSAQRPFYLNPSAVEVLLELSALEGCRLAVATSMLSHSCRPMLELLRQLSGLDEEHLPVFVRSSMCKHEDGLLFPDSEQVRTQRDLDKICEECNVMGMSVDAKRSVLVVTEAFSVCRSSLDRAVVLSPFSANDVADPDRLKLIAEELREAQQIISDDVVGCGLVGGIREIKSKWATRSRADLQIELPAVVCQTSGTDWQRFGQWFCALGVSAQDNWVKSRAKGWAGARHAEGAHAGVRSECSVRIRAGVHGAVPAPRVGPRGGRGAHLAGLERVAVQDPPTLEAEYITGDDSDWQ
mmetsp:Transcript_49860/g.143227  ORF Transcript_49860/g.143227 Transcript_49860/m.143227 type:complete len:616 (+) Transcript_49860:3-1850(+)